MLKEQWMPERTRLVFEALAAEKRMAGFNLIGGTALSIQLGHRLSEDLDFWFPSATMPKGTVDAIINQLAKNGLHCELATPAWQISQARINGIDLLAQSRDYVINGVKVTFFARNDAPYQHFASLPKLNEKGISFNIMRLDSVFHMKSWLIAQRVRSRDLFDLMVFIRNQGKTIQDILDAGQAADASFPREYAKDVLLGNVPVDQDDEGFDAVSVNTTLDNLYTFFSERVDDYEIELATSYKNLAQ